MEGVNNGYWETDSEIKEIAAGSRGLWLLIVEGCETTCRIWRDSAQASWEGYYSMDDTLCAEYHKANEEGEAGYPFYMP